ncbi:hypothetical protein P3G55_00500 [Leptospira sp. 96542]|nr:hypothetical protein [Leptospira sp. 96542]
MNSKIFAILFVLFYCTSCGPKLPISMVTSTSMDSSLPFSILEGKEWNAEEGAKFVKIHFYADEAFSLSKVEIQSCNGDFEDKIAAYVNFDEVYVSTNVKNSNSTLIFEPVVQARSVTLNFQRNIDICLKAVNFFNDKGKKYRPVVPEIVNAKVTASETGKPEASYSAMNLFDSKYENAYSSAKGDKGVNLNFEFSKNQTISKVRIWNGYQRSDVHCIKNGRLKEFTLTGDNGFSEKLVLEDTLGSQEINLKKTFEGKNLKLTVDSIYKGLIDPGFVISELRFGHKENWIVVDTIEKFKTTASNNYAEFTKANLKSVLNRGLTGAEVAEIITETVSDEPITEPGAENLDPPTSSDWTIRLRSDGTFFLEGNTSRTNYDAGEESSFRFYGMGNYEVMSSKANKMELRLFGFLRKQTFTNFLDYGEGDCNGCGRDCNLVKNPDPNNIEKIFNENVYLESRGKKFYLLNINKKHLDFSNLELVLE